MADKNLAFNINIKGNVLQALEGIRNNSKKLVGELGKIDKGFDEMGSSAKKATKQTTEGFSNSFEVITRFNQSLEVMDKIASQLSFADEISKLNNAMSLYLEGTGEDSITATVRITSLAATYTESGDEIARAANALSKQMGISFTEAMDTIEAGYKKGANLNGDFIDQLKEYPAQMKEVGLSAQQMTALIAQAGKQGIYSDKAIDTIKEANLSLKEMGKPQIDALKGIGIEVSQLAGKTSFEAAQMISKAMSTATTQAKQTVIADIFKGAGEDAGMPMIENLHKMNLNLEEMSEKSLSTSQEIQRFLGSMKGYIGTYAGGFISASTQALQFTGAIATSIPVFQNIIGWIRNFNVLQSITALRQKAITAATYLWSKAQMLVNAIMSANPIGLVIAGVIAGVALIIAYWDDLRDYFIQAVEFWAKYLNPFGWMYQLINYFFPEAGAKIRKWFSGIFDWIIEKIDMVAGWFGDLFGDEEKNIAVNTDKPILDTEGNASKGIVSPKLGFNKPTTGSTPSKTSKASTSSLSGSGSGKNITVQIDKLVEKLVIQSSTIKEGGAKIREEVTKALVGAVRDFEVSAG